MNKPRFQTQLFINNEFVDALDGATFDVLNPFDNSLLAKVAEAKGPDIDRAVAAARKAFPAWAAISPSDRGVLIGKLADAIEKDRDNLSLIESLDTGHPDSRYPQSRCVAHGSHLPLLRGACRTRMRAPSSRSTPGF